MAHTYKDRSLALEFYNSRDCDFVCHIKNMVDLKRFIDIIMFIFCSINNMFDILQLQFEVLRVF